MQQNVLVILAALLAGAVGGYAVGALQGGEHSPAAALPAGDGDLAEIVARLDRLEADQARPAPLTTEPSLRGAGKVRVVGAARDLDALATALEARLTPRLKESVKVEVADAFKKAAAEQPVAAPEVKKKRVTLAEAAAELDLTADEEASVRRIAAETTTAFLGLLTTIDESVEDIRRDFEDAKNDPKKRAALRPKYLGRVMGNLGGLITMGLTHQQKMKAALGAEKAGKIDDGYTLTDLDPYGLEDMFEGSFEFD